MLASRPLKSETCHFTQSNSTHAWHRCMGHVNFQHMRHMTTHGLVDGVPTLAPSTLVPCETCVMTKHHRSRIPRFSLTTTTRPLELLHIDVCGPLPTPSRSSTQYMLTTTDDYSRCMWVHPIALKSNVFPYFQNFKKSVEAQFNPHLLHSFQLRREYLSDKFNKFQVMIMMAFVDNLRLLVHHIKMES